MQQRRRHRNPDPRFADRVRNCEDRTDEQKHVTECDKDERADCARHQHDDVHEGALRFLRKQRRPSLEEAHQRVEQRNEVVQQPCVSRRIAEPHRLARHSNAAG